MGTSDQVSVLKSAAIIHHQMRVIARLVVSAVASAVQLIGFSCD